MPWTDAIMRLLLWAGLCIAFVNGIAHAGRPVRSLAFRKGSSFFYRLNYKINSVPYTKIFAQAAGFKAAWELPAGYLGRRFSRSVPEVYESAALVYESHGFDGRACLLKNICQAADYVRQKDGVMAKILKLLAGSYINDGTSSHEPLYCDDRVKNCPLQLIGVSGFTET